MTSFKEQSTVQLKNAVHGEVLMPVVGLGTGGYGRPDGSGGEYWGPEQGHDATLTCLKAGGRRIDSSDDYGSRDGISTGWKASGVPRSEIFITSKVDPSGYDKALEEFDGILKSLQTDYVDLLLIHWPGQPFNSSGPSPSCKEGSSTWTQCRIETWRALETLFQQKRVGYFQTDRYSLLYDCDRFVSKVRAIGVSNYQVSHLLEIFNLKSLLPSVNQVEFHPYWHEDELLDFCQKHNITFNSYAPLGTPDRAVTLGSTWNPNPCLLKHSKETAIARKLGRTPAQVILRWHWQQGVVVNPRTSDPGQMTENLSIFDFELDEEAMMILSYLNHPMSKVCGDSRLIL